MGELVEVPDWITLGDVAEHGHQQVDDAVRIFVIDAFKLCWRENVRGHLIVNSSFVEVICFE